MVAADAPRWSAEAHGPAGHLRVHEPTPDELRRAAPALLGFYNQPYNRAMMAHTCEMSLAEVHEHYEALWAEGGRPFLLELDGGVVGDGDLRAIEDGRAEVAILVGPRAAQGKGLGTRFGVLLHAIAFRGLGLSCLYASIIPANVPSQRLFLRLGYRPDASAEARRYAEDPSDLCFSLRAAEFERRHAEALAGVQLRLDPTRAPA